MVPVPIRNLLGIEVSEAEQAESNKPSHTILIDIEPLTIPLFANGTFDRFLVMHILLEVEPGEKQAYVNQQLPRLIDMFITYTLALAALDVAPGIGDRQFLKERLLAKIDETIGRGYVVNLLFSDLFERPLCCRRSRSASAPDPGPTSPADRES